MLRLLYSAVLTTSVLASAQPSRAESIDMSTITCEQLAQMDGDGIAWYLIWLDGWLAGQADDTTLDIAVLGDQIDGIANKCTDNPSLSVINAAKAYLDE